MKKKNQILCSDFDKCTKCIYFPDISVDKYPYYIDEHGIKRRDIKYICQYDYHEINTRTNICPRYKDE
jgi:hypothetical protein